MVRPGGEAGQEQGMGDCRLPGPNDVQRGTGWGAGGGAWAACGGRASFTDTAVPRIVADRGAERSVDLSVLRAGECVGHDVQGADS